MTSCVCRGVQRPLELSVRLRGIEVPTFQYRRDHGEVAARRFFPQTNLFDYRMFRVVAILCVGAVKISVPAIAVRSKPVVDAFDNLR